jgi:hypothetical protein
LTTTLVSPTSTKNAALAAAEQPRKKNAFAQPNDFLFQREAEVELATWLASLHSFLQTENLPAEPRNPAKNVVRDWSGETRVAAWGLLKCSELAANLRLCSETDWRDLAALQQILLESFALCESLAAQGKIEAIVWKSFCGLLNNKLSESKLAAALADKYKRERESNEQMPAALEFLRHHPQLQGVFGADVREIFARLNNLLVNLQRIEAMLKTDQPLKPALLLFALVQRETRDLLRFAEGILQILPAESAFQEVLDGTAYIIPLELRKVYGYELVGVGLLRQTPAVFARVENAWGLLKDCFQQAIVALAQVFAPELTASDVFPSQQEKTAQSIALRKELWNLLKQTQATEKSLDPESLENLNRNLASFRQNTMTFLMFKDVETTERFIEEIARTRRPTEIAQVLHRFGAYLETLLGQVNMRNVLAAYPFEE